MSLELDSIMFVCVPVKYAAGQQLAAWAAERAGDLSVAVVQHAELIEKLIVNELRKLAASSPDVRNTQLRVLFALLLV